MLVDVLNILSCSYSGSSYQLAIILKSVLILLTQIYRLFEIVFYFSDMIGVQSLLQCYFETDGKSFIFGRIVRVEYSVEWISERGQCFESSKRDPSTVAYLY